MAIGFHGLGDFTGIAMAAGSPTPPVPAATPAGPGAWLLDLEVSGRVFRYSTRQMEVRDAGSRSYLYQAGLADFDMTLDGRQESQAIKVVDRRVSWPLLADLTLATAILRHIEDDQVLEEALLVLEGSVDEPEYGDPQRPSSLVGTIQVDPADRSWPDPRAAVTSQTWENTPLDLGGPQYDLDLAGAVYPTVFGYPGDDGAGGIPAPATPALMVDIQLAIGPGLHNQAVFLIGAGVVDASQVRLYAPTQTFGSDGFTGAEDLAVTQTTDLLGRTVSVVTVAAASAAIWPTPGQEYYVGWSQADGGGARVPNGSGPIRSLTDVALFALRNSGRKVDLQAQEAERQTLDALLIDGLLNDELPGGLVPWFEKVFFPLFPLVRARTRAGMYWRRVNYAATPADAVAHIDCDAGRARRASSIRTPVEGVRNRFVIEGGYFLRSGQYTIRRTLADQAEAALPWFESPDLLADERVIGSPVCARSRAIFGVREASTIQTKFLWSAATMTTCLHAWAARDAFPRQPVSYTGDSREFRRRSAGDIVTVTDSEVGFDREVAVVRSLALSSDRLLVLNLEVMDRRVRG